MRLVPGETMPSLQRSLATDRAGLISVKNAVDRVIREQCKQFGIAEFGGRIDSSCDLDGRRVTVRIELSRKVRSSFVHIPRPIDLFTLSSRTCNIGESFNAETFSSMLLHISRRLDLDAHYLYETLGEIFGDCISKVLKLVDVCHDISFYEISFTNGHVLTARMTLEDGVFTQEPFQFLLAQSAMVFNLPHLSLNKT